MTEENVLTGVYLYCVFLTVSRGVASYEGCYNSVDQTSPETRLLCGSLLLGYSYTCFIGALGFVLPVNLFLSTFRQNVAPIVCHESSLFAGKLSVICNHALKDSLRRIKLMRSFTQRLYVFSRNLQNIEICKMSLKLWS